MGTLAVPTSSPKPRSSSQRITPSAAESPKALPPERTRAWTLSTRHTGFNRSVSRVPGAVPRTSTPATHPVGHKTTVQPVAASRVVQWPTCRPGTSVRVLFMFQLLSPHLIFYSEDAEACQD